VQQLRRFLGGQAVQHDGLDDGAHLRREPDQGLADVAVLDRQQHLVSAAGAAPAFPNTAATLPRVRIRLSSRRIAIPASARRVKRQLHGGRARLTCG
jgi:hypothetical protein